MKSFAVIWPVYRIAQHCHTSTSASPDYYLATAMDKFADGHTLSTKIESSHVEYPVWKTFENIKLSTQLLSTLELKFCHRVFQIKSVNSEKIQSSRSVDR